jgi:uncharacterized membrane protein YidH (DUF202 family)
MSKGAILLILVFAIILFALAYNLYFQTSAVSENTTYPTFPHWPTNPVGTIVAIVMVCLVFIVVMVIFFRPR